MSSVKTAAVAVVAALSAAIPAGAAGAVWAIHDMEKHMYFRDTPTGRQADTWRDGNLQELIVEAVNCGANPTHPDYVADADCDGEGVEVP
jgi:hypothetical protein